MPNSIPLAEKLRPKSWDDFFGQQDQVGPNSTLRNLLQKNLFQSIIVWGPPGCGKTTIARLAAAAASPAPTIELSAVQAGVKDIRACIEGSNSELKTLLFMDEVHHLNKSQQDVLLPALEQGSIRFIGATTENPSFAVNRAVLSRCLIFKLERLDKVALEKIFIRALNQTVPDYTYEAEAVEALVAAADGDARRGLNTLSAVLANLSDSPGLKKIDLTLLRSLGAQIFVAHDANGESHYDLISAFIKSIRGSHADAAVYYLARMLEGGEDPRFIARRLLILASEDIGNANPMGLLVADSALSAVQNIGMPEARIVLSQAATYLACSPKSNKAYVAINDAIADVKALGSLEVPLHLRNGVTAYMKTIGYGKNYAYAHDDPEASKKMQFLPDKIQNKRYYLPTDLGAEAQLKKNLEQMRPR